LNPAAWPAALLLATLASCGAVSSRVRSDLPAPHTIAVLPFAGGAELAVRDSTRLLVNTRLRERGLLPVDCAWVDRILSERGWLGDPAKFDPSKLPLAEATMALGVDAVVVGRDFDESRFNLFLIRRHAFGGSLAMQNADGDAWWSAQHRASNLGGLLLASGQVITELQAQTAHGTPIATLALVDEFVEDTIATVPVQPSVIPPPTTAELRDLRVERMANAHGERVLVEVHADARASVTFDLPASRSVPMAAVPGQSGLFRGAHDVEAGATGAPIVVIARDAFGRELRLEAGR
jgi:hypothetical protein